MNSEGRYATSWRDKLQPRLGFLGWLWMPTTMGSETPLQVNSETDVDGKTSGGIWHVQRPRPGEYGMFNVLRQKSSVCLCLKFHTRRSHSSPWRQVLLLFVQINHPFVASRLPFDRFSWMPFLAIRLHAACTRARAYMAHCVECFLFLIFL